MGLVSFWSNITTPRVKEITPQNETAWLERGRPNTSSAALLRGRRPDSASNGLEKKFLTANSETKLRRIGRSLSRPRKSHRTESHFAARATLGSAEWGSDVPDLPALPATLPQDDSEQKDPHSPAKSSSRPATGLTTEGLEALDVFELPAEPVRPDAPDHVNPLVRTRSNSPASETETSITKQCSQFGAGTDKALPPPPPPSIPLPPVPTTTITDERPVPRKSSSYQHVAQRSNVPRRSHSSASRSGSRPRFSGSSSESDSILEAFPPVPALIHDDERTPESSVDSSEVSSVASPTRERAIFSLRGRKVPGPINVNTTYGHQYKDSAIGTPLTPYSGKRSIQHVDYYDDDEVDVTGWTEAELREWDKVGQFMDSMQKNERYSAAGLMKSLEVDADRMRAVNANEQALAALHFDV